VADHVNPAKRSLIMASVRSRDTKPELAVRKMVHALGYRYRLHSKTLPGKPDLVFPSRRKIVLVHGCFWHRHRRCKYTTTPKTRVDYWEDKFSTNIARDKRTLQNLKKMGWAVATVWQCELKNPERLARRLDDFLSD
jgi:DNA mismatch endonuclease (patch repair protein)